jgi:hypothetical protein
MTSCKSVFPGPPVLKRITLCTLLSVFLLSGISLAGLIATERIYPDPEIADTFIPLDIVNFSLALPLLCAVLYLIHRKKLIGLLSLPGILFYLVYVFAGYLIGLERNLLFVPSILLVLVSMVAMALLIMKSDRRLIRTKLQGKVPVRTAGWIILAMGAAILVFQCWSVVSSFSIPDMVDRIVIAQWIEDLVIGVPALLLSGTLMVKRTPFGYLAGTSILLLTGVLFISLIPVLIAEGILSGTPVNIVDLLIVTISSLICFIPLEMFIRGILKAQRSQTG